jgi:hypothetical protein
MLNSNPKAPKGGQTEERQQDDRVPRGTQQKSINKKDCQCSTKNESNNVVGQQSTAKQQSHPL